MRIWKLIKQLYTYTRNMCCNLLQCLSRLLRGLCGAHNQAEKSVEEERLLRPDADQSSAPLQQHLNAASEAQQFGQLTRSALQPSAQLQGPYTTTVIVMRHGHRQDEEDPFWHQTASRPWDPPLSVKGRMQATAVASQLDGYSIDYVISSPFRRCLQTSAGVVKQLQLEQGQWLVDWQLSEVCDPRVLFSGRADLKQKVANEAVGRWMWDGLSLQTALDKFSNEDCKLNKVGLRPEPRTTASEPRYPEDLNQGLRRYSLALQEIGSSFAGKTVLVVTHGECVRMAVLLAEPHSEVFEVKHTGFVVLQQHIPAAGEAAAAAAVVPAGAAGSGRSTQGSSNAAPWTLASEPGETGVLWLEEDEDD